MWEKVVLVQVGVGFPISIFQHTIHLARRPLDPAAFSTHVCGYVCTISYVVQEAGSPGMGL